MMHYLYFIAGLSAIGIAHLFFKTRNGGKEIIKQVMIWTFGTLGLGLIGRGITTFISPDYLSGHYDEIGTIIILIPSVALVVTFIVLKTYKHRDGKKNNK